jgi:hypothetical protein
MGRRLFVNRDKWQYYTISNQHNNVKLPIIFNKKNGLNDYGVDQLYIGDIVYVEGYKQSLLRLYMKMIRQDIYLYNL